MKQACKNYHGKTILITGSSRGIGFGLAKHFYELEANVVFNARSEESFNQIKDEFDKNRALFVASDVSTPKGAKNLVHETINRFEKIDILICNVGSGSSVKLGEESYEEWQRVFAINFFSTTNMIESAKEHLIHNKSSILCISSICGINYINNAPVTYSVAKSALNNYVKGIAKFYGPHGVRINALALGNIIFYGSVWDRKLKENSDDVYRVISRDVALQKLGEVEDVVKWAEWLTASDSSFATGSIFVVDGGQIV
jgi:3-oxoacyl-[acyl-carrier protein] reductase